MISNKYIKCLVLLLVLFLQGCTVGSNGKEENIGTEYHMNEKEIAILQSIYVDEDRISRGDLLSYQLLTLEQYRFGIDYLKNKYPSYQFEILSCDPMTKQNAYATFLLKEKNGSDADYYTLHVKGEDEEHFIGEDDFYGTILAPDFESYICEQIEGVTEGIEGVITSFSSLQGEEFDEKITVEEVLKYEKSIQQSSKIYILVQEKTEQEMVKQASVIEEKIRQADIYGSYILYFVDDEETLHKGLEENVLRKGEYILKISFQNF